ncbi:MAG: hypothetical protein D6780_04870, partial [Candidatus Dadabacteria bacterium]
MEASTINQQARKSPNEAGINLAAAFFKKAEMSPNLTAICFPKEDRRGNTVLENVSYSRLKKQIEKIAYFLQSKGIKKGDRVGILSETRPEWIQAELASYTVGASVVTLYPDDPPEK